MSVEEDIETIITGILSRNLGEILRTHKELGRSLIREIFEKAELPIPPGVATADSLDSDRRSGGKTDFWYTMSTIFAGMIFEIEKVIPSLAGDLDKGFGIVQDMYGPVEWR